MIEELEQYAKESKVDELFRDIMTGCFKTRPAAPVKYILEYLASAYPEESYAHARAFIDLKDGILVAGDERECDDVVHEPECAGEAEVVCNIVEAPLMVEDTAAAPKANDAAPAEECDDVDEGAVDENESQINVEDFHDKHKDEDEDEDEDEDVVAEDSQDPDVSEAEDHEERVDVSDEDNDKDNQEEVTRSESSDDTTHNS